MTLKLLFVLFTALACGAESVSQSPCERGSSYWCENYRQATECGALVPCTEFVWKPRIGVDPYATCQASVNAMSDYVRSSVTQQRFGESLQGLCGRLHGKQEECASFFRDNEVFLFQQFKKYSSNLKLLCEGLVLRETGEQMNRAQENKIVSEFVRDVIQHFSSSPDGVVCINCQLFITQLANILRNGVIQEIIQNVFENLCSYVGEMREQCKALVDVYVDIFFASLIQTLSPAEIACTRLSYCENNSRHIQQPAKTHPDGLDTVSGKALAGKGIIAEDPKPLFCDVCMMTVKYWENILQLNRTLQALKFGLIKMCDVLPIEYEAKCREMAAQNGDKMIDMLLLYQDPRVVCTLLFACYQEQLMIGNAASIEPFCKTCRQITEFMTEQFQINKTKEAMKANINRVCETLPDVMKCKSIVEMNGKCLIKYIKNLVDPHIICQFLFLCEEKKQTSFEDKMIIYDMNRLSNCKIPRQVALPTFDLCPVCERIVVMIETFLKVNETMLTIRAVVAQVCTLLPGEEEAKCDAIVNHYGNEIIQQLLSYQKPSFICKAALLCPPVGVPMVSKSKKQISCEGCSLLEKSIAEFLPTSLSKTFVQQSARRVCKNLVDVHHIQPRTLCSTSQPLRLHRNSVVCETCKEVVAYLEGVFKVNQTMAVLTFAAVEACSIFPIGREILCRKMVAQYATNITKLVRLQLIPLTVCKRVFLCPPSRPASLQNLEDNTGCDNCKQAVAYLEGVFKMNKTMAITKGVILSACSVLPMEQDTKCIETVSQYAAYIIAMIQTKLKPITICQAIRQCPESKPFRFQRVKDKTAYDTCKQFAAFMEGAFKMNKQMAAKQLPVVQACSIFPAEQEVECKERVSQYADTMMMMKPFAVCKLLFVRPGSQAGSLQPAKENTVCDTCKQAVAFVEGAFYMNQTMESIKFALQAACALFSGKQKSDCVTAITNNADMIIGLIKSKANPEAVCKEISVCSTSEVNALQETDKADWTCETCRQIIMITENPNWINRKRAYLMFSLKKNCNLLPKTEEVRCKRTVSRYGNQIITMIHDERDPKIICKRFAVCAANEVVERPGNTMETAELCDSCKQVVAFIEGALRVNQSLAAVKEAVLCMCTILPYHQEEMCDLRVKEYANTIIGMALKGMNPVLICTTLKVCPQNQLTSAIAVKEIDICGSCKQAVAFVEGAFKINRTLATAEIMAVEMCSILPMKEEEECRKTVGLYAKGIVGMIRKKMNPHTICNVLSLCPNLRVTNMKPIVKNITKCEICQKVVFFLENSFKLNQTLAFMRVAVTEVCSIFPIEKEKECRTNVDEYAKNVIIMLENKIRPAPLCKRLLLCSLSDRSLSVKNPTNQVVCTSCKQVVAYLEGAFKINQTLEAMKFVVVQACNIVPAENKDECQKKVLQYADTMIQMIHFRMNISVICHILFFCPPGRACDTCQQAVSYVEGAFQVNQTLVALKLSVVHMCNILPLDQEEKCKTVLQQHADSFITLIQMRINPSAICTTLFFCGAHQRLEQLSQHNSGPDCALCRVSVSRVAQAYRVGNDEEALRSTMATICHSFPREYEVRCKNLLNNFGGIITNKLGRSQSPPVICQTLNLCTNDIGWRRNGCRDGQQYWCASLHNAVKCKALNYCNRIHA